MIQGSNVTFSALAIGLPEPAYQWRFEGEDISGATSATYTRHDVATNDSGAYTVVATNLSGSVTSAVAALFVHASGAATLSQFNYSGDLFTFHVYGVTNNPYVVQGSTNLIDWVDVETNYVSFNYTNYVSTDVPYRFFRALHPP